MKPFLLILFTVALSLAVKAQIDPELLRHPGHFSDSLRMNMDAVYNRPFVQAGKLPLALGGKAD